MQSPGIIWLLDARLPGAKANKGAGSSIEILVQPGTGTGERRYARFLASLAHIARSFRHPRNRRLAGRS